MTTIMMDTIKAIEDTFPIMKQCYTPAFLQQSKHINYVMFGTKFLLRKIINHVV